MALVAFSHQYRKTCVPVAPTQNHEQKPKYGEIYTNANGILGGPSEFVETERCFDNSA